MHLITPTKHLKDDKRLTVVSKVEDHYQFSDDKDELLLTIEIDKVHHLQGVEVKKNIFVKFFEFVSLSLDDKLHALRARRDKRKLKK